MKNDKNKKRIILTVSAIILIGIIVMILLFGCKNNSGKKEKTERPVNVINKDLGKDDNTVDSDLTAGNSSTGITLTTESTTLKTDSGKTDKTTTETTTRATTRTTKESTTESTTRSTTRETTRETTTRTTRESTTESTTRATTRESTTESTTRATTRENTTETTTRATTETTTEKKTEQTTKATTESTTEKTTKTTTEAATESTTKHTHNWIWKTHTETVHHDAEMGTWVEEIEPEWMEEVTTEAWIDGNGNIFFSYEDCMANKETSGWAHDEFYVIDRIWHEGVYETHEYEVKPAYDEEVVVKDYEYCSECGQKK